MKVEREQQQSLSKPEGESRPSVTFATSSGIPLERSYSSDGLLALGFDPSRDLGEPGSFPFTRGITPAMYRSKAWVMGMYSGYGSAEEANARYRALLDQGQTGFSIALDLPTQCGYDADHPMATGEVGRVGVHIGSLRDMERLFHDIPLARVRQIRTTANAIGPIVLAMFLAVLEKLGIDPAETRMFLQNDVLKEYIARGTYIFPPRAGLKLSVDVIEYCAKHLPHWTPLAMSGYHIRDSGSTAIQELAFTFANGTAYIDETLSRGLGIDGFVPQLWAFFSAGLDLLEEVAKFRAARRLWARLIRDRYKFENLEALRLPIFAYTLGSNLTAQQPLNNIARVAIETLAAVLGGVQTIATSSYDEALSIPTEEAATVALRTQQIIANETGVTGTVDPLGGAYAVEHLTCEIERRAEEYLERIEALGGAVRCIETGIFQRDLAEAGYQAQLQVERGDRAIVGVNVYRDSDAARVPVFRADPRAELLQIERLHALRSERDNQKVIATLANLVGAAESGENLIPTLVEVVKAYATIGEICDALRRVYGTYRPPQIV